MASEIVIKVRVRNTWWLRVLDFVTSNDWEFIVKIMFSINPVLTIVYVLGKKPRRYRLKELLQMSDNEIDEIDEINANT